MYFQCAFIWSNSDRRQCLTVRTAQDSPRAFKGNFKFNQLSQNLHNDGERPDGIWYLRPIIIWWFVFSLKHLILTKSAKTFVILRPARIISMVETPPSLWVVVSRRQKMENDSKRHVLIWKSQQIFGKSGNTWSEGNWAERPEAHLFNHATSLFDPCWTVKCGWDLACP